MCATAATAPRDIDRIESSERYGTSTTRKPTKDSSKKSISFTLQHLNIFWTSGSQHDILHPGRLTWNIIMEVWKIIFLYKWVICRFHVNLSGCNSWWSLASLFQGSGPVLAALLGFTFGVGVLLVGGWVSTELVFIWVKMGWFIFPKFWGKKFQKDFKPSPRWRRGKKYKSDKVFLMDFLDKWHDKVPVSKLLSPSALCWMASVSGGACHHISPTWIKQQEVIMTK